MPTARYGEAAHALSALVDGAVHDSKPYPVKTPARATCGAADPPAVPRRSPAQSAAMSARPLIGTDAADKVLGKSKLQIGFASSDARRGGPRRQTGVRHVSDTRECN